MKIFRQMTFITSLLSLILVSCSNSQVPVFDSENAYAMLKAQCDFGPRYPGSEGAAQCLEYMVNTLSRYADAVQKQSFRWTSPIDGNSYTLTNVVASFGLSGDRMLLCAHWDTRPIADYDPDPANRKTPILGANDGASGVAVLLEIARILKEQRPEIGIDIVLFDGEDSGLEGRKDSWCAGSRYFAQNKQPGYFPREAILLDMIGDRDLHLPVERNSQRYAPDLVDKVWTKAGELGFYMFDRSLGPEITDDHEQLLEVGIPAIVIIDFTYDYWHTIEDTPDKCSAESLGIIGTLLLNLIYE